MNILKVTCGNMDYEKAYKDLLKRIELLRGYSLEVNEAIDEILQEQKMLENKEHCHWSNA